MPLEGDVKEFGLADVIQLIASSQKTGVIFLDHADEQASVSFREGQITGAIYKRAGKQDTLQEYLFRSKRMDSDTVRKVLQIQNDTGLSVDEILLKEGLMALEEIQTAITAKIQEVIDDVFTWRDAHYRFDTGASLYTNSRTRVAISAEPLLMEAMRRKDEWPMISRSVPSDKVVLARIPEVSQPVDLEPDALKLYEMIDGTRTAAQLVEASGLGRFRTFNAAHILVQLGAVRKAEVAIAEVSAKPKGPSPLQTGLARALVAGALPAVCLALTAIAIFQLRPNGPASENLVLKVLHQDNIEQAQLRLEVYRFLNGAYPDSLPGDGGRGGALRYQPGQDRQSYTLE